MKRKESKPPDRFYPISRSTTFDNTSPNWRRAADLARAGGLRFPVQAIEAGCGAIALSIWDKNGRVPLDHVVHTVTVGDAYCPPAGHSKALAAGFVTLLYDATGAATQAALHLFEVAPGASVPSQTVAVYVPERAVGKCEHFDWVRTGTLSASLFQEPGFKNTLRRAWTGEGARYADLARQLRRTLFPRREDKTCGGLAALDALRRLASEPGRSLFVRVVDAHGRVLFVPLGLLFTLEAEAEAGATGSGERVFAQPPILRQPLPVESYGEPERCVGDWYFLIPPKLHGHDPEIKPPLGLAAEALLRSFDDLDNLVEEWWGAEPEPGEPAVGLVILAHHGHGELSLDDPDVRWPAADLGTVVGGEWKGARFPRGSVALLSACATGDPTKSRELISALSHAGFDTVILSPFDVHTPFGIDLATNFSRRVATALATPDRSRVADLFAAALAETADGLYAAVLAEEAPYLDTAALAKKKADYTERARGMALEFLLAGHGGLRLCAAEEARSAAEPP